MLEKTLRVPWTTRRSNQSILREVSPEYSLEGLMLKLKLQYLATWCEELTHWKRPWCWERLKVGGEGDDRGWDGWMASLTRWTWVCVNSGSWWWERRPGILQSMGSQRVRQDWTTELNWTESLLLVFYFLHCFSKNHFIYPYCSLILQRNLFYKLGMLHSQLSGVQMGPEMK